jgi:hypothetical protein
MEIDVHDEEGILLRQTRRTKMSALEPKWLRRILCLAELESYLLILYRA